MQIFGLTITRTKAAAPANLTTVSERGGWWRVIGESFPGAWQRNIEIAVDDVLSYAPVFACATLIAADIGKLRIKLVEQDDHGVWFETSNTAHSPVLRKPNHYQTRIAFINQWLVSKLVHGKTYVLKQRDQRGVVDALYVLDPTRVWPLVAPNGDVYYKLGTDPLAQVEEDEGLVVPARELIHDVYATLWHPLIGVSPILACGLAATQGQRIQTNSTYLFANGSQPGGILTAPGTISDATAARLKTYWEENFNGQNAGKVAVVSDGLKYEPMAVNPVDAQLIEQLKWTAEQIAMAFRVPYHMVGGPLPNYNNIEALNQQYYSQCLQAHIESIELLLDEGLELGVNASGRQLGTEFELDDLFRLDAVNRVTAAKQAITAGLSPNEVRWKYFDLGPVPGGDSPLVQQQNFSLEAINRRDTSGDPFGTTPAPPPADEADAEDELEDSLAVKQLGDLLRPRAYEATP